MLGINDLNKIDILDTLYGGDAGMPYLPEFNFNHSRDSSSLPDSKQVPQESSQLDYEIVPTHEISSASFDELIDIRPRIYDKIAKSWTLLDTGSQISVLKPGPEDVLDPRLQLETVDGSKMGCFGILALHQLVS